jgi:DNA processing protein
LTTRTLDPQEQLNWLRLARAESVGPVTFAHLIARFGSASEALRALPELARRGGRSHCPRIPTVAEAQAELDAGAAAGARLITASAAAFPATLKALDAPPPLLWTLGDVSLLGREMVAVVGARAASAAGRRFARDLAAGLAEAGWVVVSGMARGIDAAAHEGALSGATVAVLAGGVEDIYPPEHAALHDSLRRQGCIVSERPPTAGAKAADFPRRNRIISGLARGVVVVEAELRSGSLITARLAAEQGREVFAVPGFPLDPRARGTNDLIRQGATLVEGFDDVLRVLSALPGVSQLEPARPIYREDGAARVDAIRAPPGEDDLPATLDALLSFTPTPVNVLARDCGAPVSAVLAALTELAIAGRAELTPGNLAIRL